MKRQVAPAPALADTAPAGADALPVADASQSGLAQRIASGTGVAFQRGGVAVRVAPLGDLPPACLGEHRRALFVVSTHGEGHAPVAARRFDRHFCGTDEPRLEQLDYALLALGDTDYADSYCAFGRRLDRALRERGARALLTPIEVDKADAAALDHWHAALAHQFGVASLMAEPAFARWQLAERRILNPDSLGGPTASAARQPRRPDRLARPCSSGNGTGIAGLRGPLQARIQAGQYANWLISGERERARDFYFEQEIAAWQASGALAHLDLAFSRDADDGRYVQTVLAEQAERLREWIAAGATIFVCGSHAGMAPGATAVLAEMLGVDTVEAMNNAQRIRMDVY